MKERPILFSGAMVRAILDGKKTQTRRIISHMPDADCPYHQGGVAVGCKYGRVGDLLWVRETWAHETDFGNATGCATYRATYTNGGPCDDVTKWKPSIFMPRRYCRIMLKIMSVRVERLQSVTLNDCRMEGAPSSTITDDLVTWYRLLWDSINEKRWYGWDVNPWVWVIGFEKVEASNG